MLEEDEGTYSRVLDSVTKIVSVYLEKNDGLNPDQLIGLVDGMLKVLAQNPGTSTTIGHQAGASSVADPSSASESPAAAEPATAKEPAVPVEESVTPDYLICLEDGRKVKLLKPYLNSKYGLSPRQYREKWGLSKDYPMVAPAYSEKRTAIARASGLGARGTTRPEEPAAAPAAAEPTPSETSASEAKPATRRGRGKAAATASPEVKSEPATTEDSSAKGSKRAARAAPSSRGTPARGASRRQRGQS